MFHLMPFGDHFISFLLKGIVQLFEVGLCRLQMPCELVHSRFKNTHTHCVSGVYYFETELLLGGETALINLPQSTTEPSLLHTVYCFFVSYTTQLQKSSTIPLTVYINRHLSQLHKCRKRQQQVGINVFWLFVI